MNRGRSVQLCFLISNFVPLFKQQHNQAQSCSPYPHTHTQRAIKVVALCIFIYAANAFARSVESMHVKNQLRFIFSSQSVLLLHCLRGAEKILDLHLQNMHSTQNNDNSTGAE
jgi:hypothetical protein